MRKTIYLLFIICCTVFSYGHTYAENNTEEQKTETSSVYSDELLDVLRYEIEKDGVKYLAIDFLNKTDEAIEVNFAAYFYFNSKEYYSLGNLDDLLYKNVYTLVLQPNESISNLDLNKDSISPNDFFIKESFNRENLQDFELIINQTSTEK